jgi:hypothetical protein
MGTYWDEFLKQYPFVRHCALETTLELFYFYCDSENQDLLKEKIQKVREQFNAPLVSESVCLCKTNNISGVINGIVKLC